MTPRRFYVEHGETTAMLRELGYSQCQFGNGLVWLNRASPNFQVMVDFLTARRAQQLRNHVKAAANNAEDARLAAMLDGVPDESLARLRDILNGTEAN